MSGFEGLAALRYLLGMRLRARLRRFRRSLSQPKRLVLLLLLALILAAIFVGQAADPEGGLFSGGEGRRGLGLFLTFFMLSVSVSAVGNGVLFFSPAEVQLLFPAPVGSRALVASHLISASLKSLSAALVFSMFLRPREASFGRALAAYFLLFVLLVLLGVAIDLAHVHVARRSRRRRALRLAILLALVAAGVLGATWYVDGSFDLQTMRHLAWPARPFTGLLMGRDPETILGGLGVLLPTMLVLVWLTLGFRGTVRESASETSARLQKKLERMGRGAPVAERIQDRTEGKVLPMLPFWGGAGVHAWRQLSILLRQRRSYVTLLLMCLVVGVIPGVVSGRVDPELMAGTMLAMLSFAGPMYVQCDFRSDYENLVFLRSLPTSATALAAGQLLASTGVLYLFQLSAGLWVLLVVPHEHLVAWGAVFLALPFVTGLQLAVENGAYLLQPFRLQPAKGPPGLVDIARMYALFLAKLFVLLVVVTIAVLPAVLLWELAGLPLLGGLLGCVILLLEMVGLVWLVGRIFLSIDPGRDLAD